MDKFPSRIVNLKYTVAGLRFDAAIDCNWKLHCYGESPIDMENRVPIELYCLDHPDWDIRMCYQKGTNDQPAKREYYTLNTEVDLAGIIKETEEWIEEMCKEKPKITRNEKEDRNTLF